MHLGRLGFSWEAAQDRARRYRGQAAEPAHVAYVR
jgi:hypothetical protein